LSPNLTDKWQYEFDQGPNDDLSSDDNYVKMNPIILNKDVNNFEVAYPSEGVGLFRDPVEILGFYNLH